MMKGMITSNIKGYLVVPNRNRPEHYDILGFIIFSVTQDGDSRKATGIVEPAYFDMMRQILLDSSPTRIFEIPCFDEFGWSDVTQYISNNHITEPFAVFGPRLW